MQGTRLFVAMAVIAAGSRAGAALRITQPEVSRVEDGHPVLPPEAFNAGDTVYFSFRVEGFARRVNSVKLRYTAEPVDRQGVPLYTPVTGEEESEVRPEDKEWIPKLRGSFTLPGVMGGGECHIRLKLEDELAGESAKGEIAFLVYGPKVEPNTAFAIRDLHFYRNDEDPRALDQAAYRTAEEIHVRFEIVGFEHTSTGKVDTAYGFTIADAGGNVLFSEPAAARDQSEEFYPKPYLAGSISFQPKPDTPTGSYRLTIKAHDEIGHRDAETSASFRLE